MFCEICFQDPWVDKKGVRYNFACDNVLENKGKKS